MHVLVTIYHCGSVSNLYVIIPWTPGFPKTATTHMPVLHTNTYAHLLTLQYTLSVSPLFELGLTAATALAKRKQWKSNRVTFGG